MSARQPILTTKHYALLTGLFALFILYGSFVPFQTIGLSIDAAREQYSQVISQAPTFESKSDWAANVLLFIPLGFLLGGLTLIDYPRWGYALLTIPAMAALSAGIEFGQLWFPARNTNINDIIAETLGGVAGLAVFALFGQTLTELIRSAWANAGPGAWAAKLLPAYGLFLIIAHGLPFDLTLDAGLIWHKIKQSDEPETHDPSTNVPRVAATPYPRQVGEKMLQTIGYFAPVGLLLAWLPGPRWRDPRNITWPLLAGILVAGSIEAMQVIVVSNSAYASDVALGAVVIVFAWWLTLKRHHLTKRYSMMALGAWLIALALVHWAPFVYNADHLNQFRTIPFADYFQGNYLTAFNSMFNKLIQFAPLGYFMCKFSRGTWWGVAAFGTAMVAGIEIGQSVMSTRLVWNGEYRLELMPHPGSISDVILGTLGTICGHLLAQLSSGSAQGQVAPAPRPAPREFIF